MQVGIATIEKRINALHHTLNSIDNQGAKVNVYKDTGRGDSHKMDGICRGINFTCDDDIIYPTDYIQTSLEFLSQYPGCILTYHGRIWPEKTPAKNLNYYKSTKQFHFTKLLTNPITVDFPGTGVMFWNENDTPLKGAYRGPEYNMLDVWIGIHAFRNNIPVICCPHPAGWLKQNIYAVDGGIYRKKSGNTKHEIDALYKAGFIC